MLEFGQADLVRNFRQQFENEMTSRMVSMIEQVTGRTVLTYQSQIMFGPDIVVDMLSTRAAEADGVDEHD